MNSKRVSIIIPVRNAEKTLQITIESLRCQTLSDFELLIVDDGSTDQTENILRYFARCEPRLRWVKQPPLGLVAALQNAVRLANAPFLARMDADDTAHPNRLECQVQWLERHPECGVVGSLVRTVCQEVVAEGWRRYEQWLNTCLTTDDIHRNLFVESPLAHPSVMIRRQAIESVGGYRDFDGPEDYDLWLRIAQAGWSLAKAPEVLLEWRDHPLRLSRNDARYRREAFAKVKAYYLARGPLAQVEPRREIWIWGAGRYGRMLCNFLEENGIKVQAFLDVDGGKIGRHALGRPIIPFDVLNQKNKPLILAAVPDWKARPLIRQYLNHINFIETEDYWCCA